MTSATPLLTGIAVVILIPLLLPAFSVAAGKDIPVSGISTGSVERRLDLKIERLWSENGLTYATVRVRNTADFDFAKIKLECTSFGPGERPLDVREQMLLAPAEGLMAPGTAKTVDMLVGVRDHDVRSMSCEARAL